MGSRDVVFIFLRHDAPSLSRIQDTTLAPGDGPDYPDTKLHQLALVVISVTNQKPVQWRGRDNNTWEL